MAVGAVWYACAAEVFFEPLFCRCMSFRGEGEMDREIVEANNLDAYFLEGEGEALNRLRWYCRFHGETPCLMEKAAALDTKGNKNSFPYDMRVFLWLEKQ